jgi:long-chain acyl-CoA synthetase
MLVGDIVSMNAYRFPDKVALISDQGRLTYKQMEHSSNRIAHVLLDLGIKKGERIALIENTSIGCIQTACAVVKTGALLVNISNLLGPKELLKVLTDCEPSALIFGREYEGLVNEIKNQVPSIRHYASTGDCNWAVCLSKEVYSWNSERPKVDIAEDDPFMILYTAGTTGEPKGAVYSHRAFWENLLLTVIDTYKQSYDDSWIGPVPMYHIGGYGTLMRIFVMSNTFFLKSKFDPADYLETIEKEKVSILYAYPTMINAMIQCPEAKDRNLDSLKLVVYGGSPIPEATLQKAYEIFGCDFLQRYGATECCGSAILILSPEEHRLALSGDRSKRKVLQSAGKPSLGVRVKLIDQNDKEIKVPGQTGALVAKLQSPMNEYWRSPGETAKVLQNGWLRLGDIAKFDEQGYYYLVDREKDMIVSGARNIYPREVEEVLYSHPSVREACVIGVPDDYWGEAVKAIVALKPGAKVDEESLINYCKQHMASYKKPKSIDFVEALPKNPGGKIMKRELRKKYWEGKERFVH